MQKKPASNGCIGCSVLPIWLRLHLSSPRIFRAKRSSLKARRRSQSMLPSSIRSLMEINRMINALLTILLIPFLQWAQTISPTASANLGETLVQPWGNLGETLAERWWNLLQKLLATQDGSAPQNHRESESNSAPKPLLWLKTPKLLLLGKNTIFLNHWGCTKQKSLHQCLRWRTI